MEQPTFLQLPFYQSLQVACTPASTSLGYNSPTPTKYTLMSIGSFGWYVCHNFLEDWVVKIPCTCIFAAGKSAFVLTPKSAVKSSRQTRHIIFTTITNSLLCTCTSCCLSLYLVEVSCHAFLVQISFPSTLLWKKRDTKIFSSCWSFYCFIINK